MGNEKYNFFYFLLFTSYFLLLTFYLLGCAPKAAPPPLYKDIDLTLQEIIETAQRDINSLKAVAGIKIEKDNSPYFYIDSSLILKKPNWLRMRWYRFGMLTGSLLIKDNVVHTASGKDAQRFKQLGNDLYYSVFWWEGIENASMHKQGSEYIIRTKNKEIRLDKSTLLPRNQEIRADGGKIQIKYNRYAQIRADTRDSSDLWYPSELEIDAGSYRFTVKILKFIINPPLEENEFETSGQDK